MEIVIKRVERLRNSASGNPRYRAHLDGGATLTTQADSAVNYEISNSNMLDVPLTARLSSKGEVVRLEQQA